VVAVGGPLDAGSVPGVVAGLVVVGAGLLVVAGPFTRPGVVVGALVVVGAAAAVVDVAPPVVAGSLVLGDVEAGAVVLGMDVEPGPVVGGTVSPVPVPSVVGGAAVVGALLAEPSSSVSSTTSLAASGRPSSLMATTWYMRATPWGAAGSVKEVIWRSPSSAMSPSW